LDSTGLTTQVLIDLTTAIRHSKSLLCFHLDSNVGITKKVKQFWR